jgi:hypothetical protein
VKRAFFLLATLAVLVLALGGVALAATPQEIYNDYAADGKLDGTYTDAELRAYLADSLLDQYGNPAILTALDGLVNAKLSEGHGEFPFTGAQIALMAFAAMALIGGGVGLRRLARSRT